MTHPRASEIGGGMTLAQIGGIAARRRWWLIVPLAAGIALALLAWQLLPPAYRASTLIMAEPQKVPSDYVKATVTSSLQDRLKSIEQQITNRDTLATVIRDLGLYPRLRRERGMEEAVAAARNDLTIQVLGQTVLRIYFRSRSPELAAKAANRLADTFIQENLQVREEQAQTTSNFLEAELDEMRQKLEAQEAKIAEFKLAHIGELPEQRDTNLGSVGQLQQKLRMVEDSIGQAQIQRSILLSNGTAVGAPAGPDRLAELREQLATLQAQYTDQHPDVIRTKQEIAELERAQAKTPASVASGLDPRTRAQVDALDGQIRMLQGQRAQIVGEMGGVQSRLENIPRVEQELTSLTRDYENTKDAYDSLLSKRLEARLAENLEKRRQSDQFTILERAMPPDQPYEPNLPLLLAIGVAGGLLIGVAAAVVREQTDQTYADVDDFRKDFPGVPLLANVPNLVPARATARPTRRTP